MPAGAIPFPFGHCRICKDKATGVHYGVATCEGCKGFFKRSISKADKYKCFFGGECDLNPKNRNRCKCCRYRRCLETGMSVEAVKMGRIPKVEKEKALEALHAPVAQTESPANGEKIGRETDSNFLTPQSVADKKSGHSHFGYINTSHATQQQPVSMVTDTGATVSSGVTNCYSSDTWQKHQPSVVKNPQQVESFSNRSLKGGNEDIYEFPTDPQPPQNGHFLELERHGNYDNQDSYMDKIQMDNVSMEIQAPVEFNCQSLSSSNVPSQHMVAMDTTMKEPHFPEQVHNNHNVHTGQTYQSSTYARSVSYDESHTRETPQIHNVSDHQVRPTGNMDMKNPSDMYPHQPHIPTSTSFSHGYGLHQSYPGPTYSELAGYPSPGQTDLTRAHESGSHFCQQREQQVSVGPAYHSMPSTVSTNFSLKSERRISDRSQNEASFQNANSHSPLIRSSSTPGLCPTPSSVEGSTSSSHINPYSPALIKVLIEQVVDTMGEQDITQNLVHRLRQNKVDGKTVSKIMNIVKEVSVGGQKGDEKDVDLRDRHLEMDDSKSIFDKNASKLSENKMAYINRFLKDIDRFSSGCSSVNEGNSIDHNQKSTGDGDSGMLSAQSESKTITSSRTLDMPDSGFRGHASPGNSGSDSEGSRTNNRLQNIAGHGGKQDNEASYENSSRMKQTEGDLKQEKIEMSKEQLNEAKEKFFQLKYKHREILRLRDLGALEVSETGAMPEEVKEAYKIVISSIPHLNERILGFCERVPGFGELDCEDREVLLKKAYYDIWMLTSAESFTKDGKVNIILVNGQIYARRTMEKIVNKEIVETMFQFTDKFNAMKLTDLEICIICAVQLTCTDNLKLKNKSAVNALHSHMLDVLASEVAKNHVDNHSRLLIDLFRLMPLLETINSMQQNFIANFSVDDHV